MEDDFLRPYRTENYKEDSKKETYDPLKEIPGYRTYLIKGPDQREVYLCYYWLILNIDPYKDLIRILSVNRPCPDYVNIAMYEVSEGRKKPYTANKLLHWCIEKDIPLLYTQDGKPICCLADVKRLWNELEIKSIDDTELEKKAKENMGYYNFLVEEEHRKACESLEAYLLLEHKKNLLELDQPGQGEGKATKTPAPPVESKTKEVLYILGAIASIVSLLYLFLPKLDIALTWTDFVLITMILGLLASIATLIMRTLKKY